jgi:hypothetical protein
MRRLLVALTIAAAGLAQEKSGPPLPAAGNVTLPLDEYNRLIELAAKPAKKPDVPPLPHAIKHADLKFQVAGETVSGSIQLDGEIFAAGPVKVPLATGLAIFDAQQRGKELPLQQEGGTHAAILTGPAEFSILLQAGLPITTQPGRASFQFPALAAGTARLTLEIPGENTNVSLSPGLIVSRKSGAGRTTIEAALLPGQPSTISWATREAAAAVVPREVRFLPM